MKTRARTTKRSEKQGGLEGDSSTSCHEDSDQETALWQEITDRLEEFCQEHGFRLSPSRSHLIGDLIRMRKLWGDYYCPCQPARTPETVCICSAAREGLVDLMGACFCQLIIED